MSDYILAVLVGRLAKNPALRRGVDGLPYARLRLVVRRNVPRPDGSVENRANFFTIVARHAMAELACRFAKKGTTIMVVGYLEQIRRRDEDGKAKGAIVIHAERIQFLDKTHTEASTQAGSRENPLPRPRRCSLQATPPTAAGHDPARPGSTAPE